MKLSPIQQKTIALMQDGWELGVSGGFSPRCWIQKNGIGKGGESLNLKISTFHVLLNKKLIKKTEDGYPTSKYKLTKLGEEQ